MFGREPKDFRETLHAAVTPYPTAEWAAQRIVEWCARDLWPPRFLIHDRDSHYGATFDCRLRHVGIEQVRTPFRAPPDRSPRADIRLCGCERQSRASSSWLCAPAHRVSYPSNGFLLQDDSSWLDKHRCFDVAHGYLHRVGYMFSLRQWRWARTCRASAPVIKSSSSDVISV